MNAGFVVTTAACFAYLEVNRLPEHLMADVKTQIAELERKTGKRFGVAANPLLVSVRSGSAMSICSIRRPVAEL